MKYLDLNSNVLAIKCIKSHIFIGIGCTLYILNNKNLKENIKINILHPDNIHGIINKSDDKLIIFGEKSLCILNVNINTNFVMIEQTNEVYRFNDRIINVEWLDPVKDPTLTILFAHNNVYTYNIYSKQYYNTYCIETCLLYAGAISGSTCKTAIIFSGTVFQEILIWKVTNNNYSNILHRLKGHKGVILSIFYNSLHNFICSTSDDRTVRLWKLSNTLVNEQNRLHWENVKISLQATMYGHLARVWKAIQFKDIIASIGEDSRICFWNLNGELIYKIEAHQGAPIWCIDISQEDFVFTGGGDGSINSWSLAISSYLQNYVLLKDNNDIFPKYVTFIDNKDILIYSNFSSTSKILQFNSNYQLLNTYNLPKCLSTYCIIDISVDRQCIALASIKGCITLYKRIGNVWKKIGNYKIIDTKIISMQWIDHNTILICIANGYIYVLQILADQIYIFSEHVLPTSRENWVTSACMGNNLLICGDRMGSLFVYNLKNNIKYPIQSFKKIHGMLGVQSCTITNHNLITTGRDGTIKLFKFYDIGSKNASIKFLHTKIMPMDWVSRLLMIQNDYYVLGFKEKDFIIYSLVLKRILVKIPCGGGHRSWDCILFNKIIYFVYIQKKQAYVVTVPLKTRIIPSLLNGFHTKKIYCIKILKTLSKHQNFLISGSEDSALVLSYINFESQIKLEFLDSFDGHLSSIKCISIYSLLLGENKSKHLIFSGGGRAQLKIWEMTIKTNKHTFSNENICCKDLLSYMLYGSDNKRSKVWVKKELMYNKNAETRYMDITTIENPHNVQNVFIFIACSDGCLRSLTYDIESNQLKLIDTMMYKNRCILKVHSFNHQGNILLITMSTDGLLKLWNVVPVNDTIIIKNIIIDDHQDFSLHQSGVNSFDIKILNNYDYILATGGDDNLLNLLTFKIILSKHDVLSVQIISLCRSASVHSAQITGIKLMDFNKLISVGADQKLVLYTYSYNNSQIRLTLLKKIDVCVTDVQGITFCENQIKNCQLFCVYGKGFQVLQL